MNFEIVRDRHRKFPQNYIELPITATFGSAGYDFKSNEEMVIHPGQTYIFWTDIKVKLANHEFLMIVPRSSIGIKKSLMLANTVGIIDSDYYDNMNNDGNIAIALHNYGNVATEIHLGERIAQGIVMNHNNFNTYTDSIMGYDTSIMFSDSQVDNVRLGGLGSTGD